jgi:hypothetical protein
MQPYQQASEESNRQSYRPFQAAATAAIPAAKSLMGGKIASMLSKYIPANLAMKGLSKIDPRLGKFASLAQEAGHSFDEVKGFIGEKIQGSEEPAKQAKNIIEQESPELHQFVLDEIKKGRKPIEAAALAQNDKRFADIVKKLMKKHKTSWSKIIEGIFGVGDTALSSKEDATKKFREHQKKQTGQQRELDRFNNYYGPQQGQQQQPNQVAGNAGQLPQQGNPQAKQQLLQAMQALSQQLKT